jgi:hypothetical protein
MIKKNYSPNSEGWHLLFDYFIWLQGSNQLINNSVDFMQPMGAQQIWFELYKDMILVLS